MNSKILYTRGFPENTMSKPSKVLWYAALLLRHFNAFVTKLANYDDLVTRRECMILVLLG